MNEHAHVIQAIQAVASEFAGTRGERQKRTHLDPDDFRRIADTGYLELAVPARFDGLWRGVSQTVGPLCAALRALAQGDSSVALVSAMHPAVLSYWLCLDPDLTGQEAWDQQCQRIFDTVRQKQWWGTITSEPGSGGDVQQTRTLAEPDEGPNRFRLTGQKHFGSGSGVTSYMVTTARVADIDEPDWFFVKFAEQSWDGAGGLTMTQPWEGQGMTATQSHAFQFQRFPGERIAAHGQIATTAARTGGLIGCLFASVVVGIVDVAVETARQSLQRKRSGGYERSEWIRVQYEYWLLQRGLEGMISAVQATEDSRKDVLLGKTALAELAEAILGRVCRVMGGSSFSRHTPFGFWFEDVRALGFLRPPWNLAFQSLEGHFPELQDPAEDH